MNKTHTIVAVLLALLCLFASPAGTCAQDQAVTNFDRWYVMEISGQRAGYMHVTERQKEDRIITQTDMSFSVKRDNAQITIEVDSWFVETVDGKPVEASSTMKPGAMAIVQHYQFTDDQVKITTGQGAAANTATQPLPDPSFHPPAAAQRVIAEAIESGDKEISVGMLDISMGLNPMTMSSKVIGKENVEVFGKIVPAIVWEATMSNMPGLTVKEYVDEHGRGVKTTVQIMPGMEMVVVEADEQLAKSEIDPPRIMAQTLLRPDKSIPNARQSRNAIYNIRIKGNGDTPTNLPRTGYQRVVWNDKTTATVVVDMDEPVNVIDDLPTDADLASSDMIDFKSEAVQEVFKKALADINQDEPNYVIASRFRAFVHSYIEEKDLSFGLARASQIAQTAQGDCTEHAVLLAALLRAKGIPARTVSGLLYVDDFLGQQGVFGYHMWTQAWLTDTEQGPEGGRWVDLDAVLRDRDFDAAHITLSVSSMADGNLIGGMIDMLPTFGRIDIQVRNAE